MYHKINVKNSEENVTEHTRNYITNDNSDAGDGWVRASILLILIMGIFKPRQ